MERKLSFILIGIAAFLLLTACPNEPPLNGDKEITAFSFTSAANSVLPADASGNISGDNITVNVPPGTPLTSLTATFTTTGVSVTVNGTEQTSGATANDFTSPLTYIVTAEDGSSAEYSVTVTYYLISNINPANGSATAEISAILSWDVIDMATIYQVQIAASEAGVETAEPETTTTNSLNPAFPPAGFSWYWRVRALSGGDVITGWSDITVLRLNWTSFPVSLNGPSAGISTDDTTPELSWTVFGGAEHYELQIGPSDISQMEEAAPLLSANENYQFGTTLDNNTDYYWRARAVATDALSGETIYSAYSGVRSFTVSWGAEGPADGICFAEELACLNNVSLLGGSYTLNADIDLSEYGDWTPIGTEDHPFTGSFDGDGHTVNGLTITNSSSSFQGLFGYTIGATIRDVYLSNVYIVGSSRTGALVGYCYSFSNHNSLINGCSADGIIEATSGEGIAGGLIGLCEVKSNNPGNLSLLNNFTKCTVMGINASGGLIGKISSLWASGGNNSVESFTISNNHSEGSVSGHNNTGGLIGSISFIYTHINISNSYATGNVNGSVDNTGGLIGSISKKNYSGQSTVSYCYSLGDIIGTNNTGGLIGYFTGQQNILSNSFSTGKVQGGSYAGGLIGRGYDYLSSQNSTYGTIISCFSTGNVLGTGNNIGGLVGICGPISNSYATGDVIGIDLVGGLIGSRAIGEVLNCFAIGNVSGESQVQGLGGTSVASFYDRETSGQLETDSGIPKSTTDMKTLETYLNAGWDFVNETTNGEEDIWNIDPYYVINDGYPYLDALPPQ